MNSLIMQLVRGVWLFALYSFGGWIAQGIFEGLRTRHFVNSGFLYGPLVPIYGFGALLITYTVDRLTHSFVWVFILSFLFCSTLEYFTSWAMQKIFHRRWWNYSKRPFNINGRVCLLNSTLYGLGGLVITFVINPWIDDLFRRISDPLKFWGAAAFLLIFVIDIICTVVHMKKLKALEEQEEKDGRKINLSGTPPKP